MGPEVPPEEKKEPEGLKLGVDSEGDHQRAGVARAGASGKKDYQHWTGKFDFRSASEFLLTLDDDTRDARDAQARAELPGANREQQIIRAAELAMNGTRK